MQIVIGPRQTGKTTAILQALEVCGKPHHYVSADDPVLVSPEWLRNEWEQARRTPPRSCPTQKSWASCLTRATR
jgi:predicted AAA+ superfamily ATPase